MKITIELTKAEVAGLKRYIAAGEVAFSGPNKVRKDDIAAEISERVHGNLHAKGEAVSDFIIEEEEKSAQS